VQLREATHVVVPPPVCLALQQSVDIARIAETALRASGVREAGGKRVVARSSAIPGPAWPASNLKACSGHALGRFVKLVYTERFRRTYAEAPPRTQQASDRRLAARRDTCFPPSPVG